MTAPGIWPSSSSCYRQGRAQHNPPEDSKATRYVRVVHPNHPLAGQVVRVVRLAGHPAFPERQWVIEQADGTRVSLLHSWAVPEDNVESEKTGLETSTERPWTDVPALLNLARMVRHVTEKEPEGVEHHEPCNRSGHTEHDSAVGTSPHAERGLTSTPPVGGPPAGISSRTGDGLVDDRGQAVVGATGGERGGDS